MGKGAGINTVLMADGRKERVQTRPRHRRNERWALWKRPKGWEGETFIAGLRTVGRRRREALQSLLADVSTYDRTNKARLK